jgi:hypothetical protein
MHRCTCEFGSRRFPGHRGPRCGLQQPYFRYREIAAPKTRQAENSALFVEQFTDFAAAHVLAFHEEENDGGVNISAAGAHDEAFQGRKSHARVHAPAALHRADAAPVSQMADDEF